MTSAESARTRGDGAARRVGTLSYLPPLTEAEVGLQVRSLLQRGLVPAVEWTADPSPRDRYWAMWGLPLFDVRSVDEVMSQLAACANTHPDAYVKLVGYDPRRQSQVVSLVVRRPAAAGTSG